MPNNPNPPHIPEEEKEIKEKQLKINKKQNFKKRTMALRRLHACSRND